MTRKHFIEIAASLEETKPSSADKAAFSQWLSTVFNLTNTLASFNPRFDRGRFLSACGYVPGEYEAS